MSIQNTGFSPICGGQHIGENPLLEVSMESTQSELCFDTWIMEFRPAVAKI